MARTRIKICGIKDVETALAAADAGADMIGLVFVEKSPRYVQIDQAKIVVSALPAGVTPVGLFADHEPDEINRISKAVGLKTVQLHGHEPFTLLNKLNDLHAIKAIPFGPQVLRMAEPWEQCRPVAALLLDTPPNGELTGGSGQAFDWSQLAAARDRFTKPIILAGGLTPDNVGEAIRTVRPDAVDVSSGVESSRGVKDVGLIKAFCEAVYQADSQ